MLTSVICCIRQFFHRLLYNPFRVVAIYIYVYVHILLNALYSAMLMHFTLQPVWLATVHGKVFSLTTCQVMYLTCALLPVCV